MVEQRNLYMIVNDINSLRSLLSQGFTVLLCTEDSLPPDILVHPCASKVSVLLPPYACVSLESDRQFDVANAQYWNYLSAYRDAASICNMVYIAALIGKGIVLYLGSEYNDLSLIQNLPNYFANNLGIGFGMYGPGWINTDFAPTILMTEYFERAFTAIQILSFYPKDTDFPPQMVDNLIMELHAPVQIGDYKEGNEYLKSVVRSMNGTSTDKYGQPLYCPFMGGYGGNK